jgi:hypothetical protein
MRSTSEGSRHFIKSLQIELSGFNPETLFQRNVPKYNMFLNSACNALSEVGLMIADEVVLSDENSRISKYYFNLIASENLVTLVSKYFPNSIINHYAKYLKKSLGIKYVGQLIN